MKSLLQRGITIGLLSTMLSFLLQSCMTDTKGELESELQSLELQYIAWACDCANWATPEDVRSFGHNYGDTLARLSIFIEAAPGTIPLPDSISYSKDVARFTGRFYTDKGFPEGYFSHESPEPARVFQYTSFEIISSHKHAVEKAIQTSENIEPGSVLGWFVLDSVSSSFEYELDDPRLEAWEFSANSELHIYRSSGDIETWTYSLLDTLSQWSQQNTRVLILSRGHHTSYYDVILNGPRLILEEWCDDCSQLIFTGFGELPEWAHLNPSPMFRDDFNGDGVLDLAMTFDWDGAAGMAIFHGEQGDFTLLSGGEDWPGLKGPLDLSIYDQITTLPAGNTIAPTLIDSLTGDILGPDHINAVHLTSAALKFDIQEACGGGYIYWNGETYNWMSIE